MNSVLQALLHTPPLRNYFLSDRHNRYVCQKNAQRLCLACDMDAMFSAAFSGDRTPYSPAQFLYRLGFHFLPFSRKALLLLPLDGVKVVG
jgi:ubiquitin carboxyl-terminal hydrolase 22/27/51